MAAWLVPRMRWVTAAAMLAAALPPEYAAAPVCMPPCLGRRQAWGARLVLLQGVRLRSAATGHLDLDMAGGVTHAISCRTSLNRCRGVEGNGRYLRYLTVPEVLRRYATASQRKGRFIPEG